MKDKAIEKINAEMQKKASDPYTEIVGHYIIDRCLDATCAEKVMQSGKSLRGAMDAIMAKAKAARNGNVAVLTPAAVFGAVDEHFGFETDEAAQFSAVSSASSASSAPAEPPRPKAPERASGSIISLEDFL